MECDEMFTHIQCGVIETWARWFHQHDFNAKHRIIYTFIYHCVYVFDSNMYYYFVLKWKEKKETSGELIYWLSINKQLNYERNTLSTPKLCVNALCFRFLCNSFWSINIRNRLVCISFSLSRSRSLYGCWMVRVCARNATFVWICKRIDPHFDNSKMNDFVIWFGSVRVSNMPRADALTASLSLVRLYVHWLNRFLFSWRWSAPNPLAVSKITSSCALFEWCLHCECVCANVAGNTSNHSTRAQRTKQSENNLSQR